MFTRSSSCCLRVLSAVLTGVFGCSQVRADVVTDWNLTALAASDAKSPRETVRAPAITRTAIFDAVNSIFFLGKGGGLWNAAARSTAAVKGGSIVEHARIFAIMNMAMMDATISGWAIKKQYPLWRTITAICEATAAQA